VVGKRFRGWLGRRTLAQLSVAVGVLAALALTGSLVVTGLAVRAEQRKQAALAALADYAAMASKLGADAGLAEGTVTAADAAYFSTWLAAFQDGPAATQNDVTLEETCRTGRGGAGVRLIRAPVGKPAGLAALEEAPATRLPGLGDDVYAVHLAPGQLCPRRAVDVVVVAKSVGALDIRVGRVVAPMGDAWIWAVATVAGAAGLILITALAGAVIARGRLTVALDAVSRALEGAAVGDLSRRAPEEGVAPELDELTRLVNQTLDRLDDLLSWLRDSSDQLAHDFRTPLARATARLEALEEATTAAERRRLLGEVRADLGRLSQAMAETLMLRDGQAWAFEKVDLAQLLRATAELYEPLAETRGISVRVEAEPCAILGVRSLIQRALVNLTDNAVKFSPDGGTVTLTVRAEGDGAVLRVADQGGGFGAVAEGPGGSHGMGLPFVRAVMRRHGGSLEIAPADPGTVVTARFSR
jgi:signal transduction histidine kinase